MFKNGSYFDNIAATEFARIKNTLLRSGTPIEDMDILIGAHARACGFTLVTDNEKHFKRIEGLRTENWIERK
jgi:tRNA(fMet)-specific endonuclease VapC